MLHGRLHNNGLLRVRQYQRSLDTFSTEWAREIVSRKIAHQRAFLMEARDNRTDLRFPLTDAAEIIGRILESVNGPGNDMDQLRGYEGGASAAYFRAYTKLFPESLAFTRRTRRPPEDPVNALLSLCYTLLHFEAVREIEVIGLDPTIGFLHQFEYGRESLACDLVELYRTGVDRFVYELFRERKFTSRDFAENDERPGCFLKKESRQRFYPLYEEWAKAIRLELVKEVRHLAERIAGEEELTIGDEKHGIIDEE